MCAAAIRSGASVTRYQSGTTGGGVSCTVAALNRSPRASYRKKSIGLIPECYMDSDDWRSKQRLDSAGRSARVLVRFARRVIDAAAATRG